MADEYALVSKGKLKLKTDSETKKKKKKQHKKEKEKLERGKKLKSNDQIFFLLWICFYKKICITGAQEELESIKTSAAEHNSQTRHLTKAELAYKKMQEKMVRKLCGFFKDIEHRNFRIN